jgi:hypothetical protein
VLCDVVAGRDGRLVLSTSAGLVARYRPGEPGCEILAEGLDTPAGLVETPSGDVVVAESGTGRLLVLAAGTTEVIAGGLGRPLGVAQLDTGTFVVSDPVGGRVHRIVDGRSEIIASGLAAPSAIAAHGSSSVVIVESDAKVLSLLDLASRDLVPLVEGLAVQDWAPLPGLAQFPCPVQQFPGVAVGPSGDIYTAGDADGSVLVVRHRD